MIRTALLAAGLILGAGSAFAQDVPSYDAGAASIAHNLGASASPAYPYGSARPALHRDVETTGSVAPRAKHQRVMGLPVLGSH